MEVGLRVVRGPDWKWGNQDEGEGHVGTVVEVGRGGSCSTPEKTVVVQWDSGSRTNYRTGYMGAYDLRVFDSAPIGVRHPNISCNGCNKHGIAGMRWKCSVCSNFDLCSYCYHADKHDLSHSFLRFDHINSTGIPVPKRSSKSSGVKVTAKGIFVGARVMRGFDWDWGNQDGGEGKVGRVIDIRGWDNESRRSVANVMWSSGSSNVYRLGHKGKVDLKCTVDADGGRYYRDHLPVLGEVIPSSALSAPSTSSSVPAHVSPTSSGPSSSSNGAASSDIVLSSSSQVTPSSEPLVNTTHSFPSPVMTVASADGAVASASVPGTSSASSVFHVGDKVKVIVEDEEELKRLQAGHGGWNPRMARFLGRVGTIHRTTEHGDLRVKFPESQLRWTFNPAAIIKIQSFGVGDIVRIIEDETRVKELQAGHGEWIDQMRRHLGKKGKIVKVYLDSDIRVLMDGTSVGDAGTIWTLNPLCVTLVSSAPAPSAQESSQTNEGESGVQRNGDGELINSLSVRPNRIDAHQQSPEVSLPNHLMNQEVMAVSDAVRGISLSESSSPPESSDSKNKKDKRTAANGQVIKLTGHKSTAVSSTTSGNSTGEPQQQETLEKLRYLESKITEIEEAFCCSICMERVKNVVFLCGHGACVVCAQNLTQCHMCREHISRRINIY